MKVTVAICTWNRCDVLADTLSALADSRIPRGVDWEVIVVNNNCVDDTDQVIESFRASLPIVRVFEARPGLSHARNAGVAVATGDYVLCTDDDVIVSPDWVAAYAEAVRRHPDGAVFGGPIRPHFDFAPPHWIVDGLDVIKEAFGGRDSPDSDAPIVLESRQLPFGANYMVRRQELLQFPYDTRVGRSPSNAFLGGEEIGVMGGILAAGYPGWWVPAAGILHRIRADQMSMDYVRRYYVGVGRWMGLSDRSVAAPRLLGRPRWMLKELALRHAKMMLRQKSEPSLETLREMKAIWILHGRIQAASSKP